MNRYGKAILFATVTAVALVPVLSAYAQTAPAAAPAEPDPAAVERMIAAIDAAIEALPPTATSQDIEAAVTFTIDQQQQPVEVAKAAVTFIMGRKGGLRKVNIALRSVLAALNRGLAGTGAIVSGGAGSLSAGPSVGGGGGSATYTTTN